MTESSTVENTDAIAESSTAETEQQGESTLLDAVNSAIEAPVESPTAEPERKAEGESPKTEPTDLLGEPSPDELKSMKPKTAERVTALLDERKALRAEIEPLRESARKFEDLTKFSRDAGLEPGEIAATLEIASLFKTNPSEALARLDAIRDQLRAKTGDALPPDLEEQVRLGYVTEPLAKETARLRAQQEQAAAQSKVTAEQQQARQARQDFDAQIAKATDAVNEWERAKATSDPDWNAKADLIREKLRGDALALGRPPTPQEVVKMAEQAAMWVNEQTKRWAPARPAVNRAPTGQFSGRAKAEPGSLLDAVNAGLGV